MKKIHKIDPVWGASDLALHFIAEGFSLRESMDRILSSPQMQEVTVPTEGWHALDYATEATRGLAWFQAALEKSARPRALRGLWFGLTEDKVAAMRLFGSTSGSSNDKKADWCDDLDFDPEAPIFESPIFGTLGDHDFLFAWTLLLAADCATEGNCELILGKSPSIAFVAGYDGGDWALIGKLTRSGLIACRPERKSYARRVLPGEWPNVSHFGLEIRKTLPPSYFARFAPKSEPPKKFLEFSVSNQGLERWLRFDLEGKLFSDTLERPWEQNEWRAVNYSGKYGFANSAGQIVIEPRFVMAEDFQGEAAAVKLTSGWGRINRSGEVILDPRWADPARFHGDYAVVKNKSLARKRWALVNQQGKILRESTFGTIHNISEGLLRVHELFGKPGDPAAIYYDMEGDEVLVFPSDRRIEPQSEMKEGLIYSEIGRGKSGFIDPWGNVQIVLGNAKAFDGYKNGYCQVSRFGNWGAIDRDGVEVIPARFEFVSDAFANEMVPATARDKYGILNMKGNWELPPVADFYYGVPDPLGKMRMTRSEDWIVNRDGDVLWPSDKKGVSVKTLS